MPAEKTFNATVQRTVRTSRQRCWHAWANTAQLSHWFTTSAWQEFRVGGRYENSDGDSGVFLEIVPDKLLRFTWENRRHQPGSEVSVSFAVSGSSGAIIRLQHRKLKNKRDAVKLKQGWNWAMDSLKSFLETGRPISHSDWSKKQNKKPN